MATPIISIRKANGAIEPFDVAKLERSLERVHASPTIAAKVIDHLSKEIEDGMTTHDIYKQAFAILRKLERPAAARYSLRRALMDLGPSGFPFERFVAEIFKAQGYETLTDQMVMGSCVEHEVDVVAWKPEKLVMCEAKFHHELGMKSDLKVVLYVKARFDDLAGTTFNYGGAERTLDEGMLVTNTKFTSSAVKYAECKNMRIVGWNYPAKGNLHEMIESAGLHPVTCLNSLSEHDKKALLDGGVVLCSTLENDRTILERIGLTAANIDVVMDEIGTLTEPA